MKMVSFVVSGLGILALVLGFVELLVPIRFVHVTHGGCLRAAETLFLLAVLIILIDRNYCTKSGPGQAPKS
jgi:hypothetical protein